MHLPRHGDSIIVCDETTSTTAPEEHLSKPREISASPGKFAGGARSGCGSLLQDDVRVLRQGGGARSHDLSIFRFINHRASTAAAAVAAHGSGSGGGSSRPSAAGEARERDTLAMANDSCLLLSPCPSPPAVLRGGGWPTHSGPVHGAKTPGKEKGKGGGAIAITHQAVPRPADEPHGPHAVGPHLSHLGRLALAAAAHAAQDARENQAGAAARQEGCRAVIASRYEPKME
jgi:hypothetical protein